MRYWNGVWPNLGSVSISLNDTNMLSATDVGILYNLTWYFASQCVYSQFNEPSPDPHIRDEASFIRKIAGCSRAEWNKAEASIRQYFSSDGAKMRLIDQSVIRFTKEGGRSALPASVRAQSLHRDGSKCVYCGNENGPFHFDHLWPVSKGGSDDANNIVIACAPCNLSKGGKTLAEWVGAK